MTNGSGDPQAAAIRIEALLAEVRACGDARLRAAAEDLLRHVTELYGAGLSRMMDLAYECDDAAAAKLFDRLAGDPLVSSLLALHGLHPHGLEAAPEVPRIGVDHRGTRAPLFQMTRADATPVTARRGERCGLCSADLGEDHGHVVKTSTRSLVCVCRVCYLLFTHDGAAGGRYRAVPERYVALDADIAWETFNVPVGVAFFMFNSELGRVAAFYPGPAGATESLLPLDAWTDVARANPVLEELAPDVEAVLVRRTRDQDESFIVPIDACYELAGTLRREWRGFEGGEEARQQIDRFFDRVRERARPLVAATETT